MPLSHLLSRSGLTDHLSRPRALSLPLIQAGEAGAVMTPCPPASLTSGLPWPHFPRCCQLPALPRPSGKGQSPLRVPRESALPIWACRAGPPGATRSSADDEEDANRQTHPQCHMEPWDQDESPRETGGLLWPGARCRVQRDEEGRDQTGRRGPSSGPGGQLDTQEAGGGKQPERTVFACGLDCWQVGAPVSR